MNKKGERYEKTCNTIKSEKQILRIDHKLSAIRQNYAQQATSALVEQKPSFICMEDLNVQGMMRNKHLAKAVQDQGFYEFRREVEYKAEALGIHVIIADRYYPSSKTCARCGHGSITQRKNWASPDSSKVSGEFKPLERCIKRK